MNSASARGTDMQGPLHCCLNILKAKYSGVKWVEVHMGTLAQALLEVVITGLSNLCQNFTFLSHFGLVVVDYPDHKLFY